MDNRTVRDATKIVNDQALLDDDFNEAAPPADRFDIVFDKSDLPTDGLVMQAATRPSKTSAITATLAGPVADNKSLRR